MNYEGERFLLKLYRELYNEEEVKHSGTKSDDKFKLINKYMKRLEKSEKVFDGDHEGLEKYMRKRYYDRYVIKEEDIPDSYYELQKKIALEQGYGHVEYTPNMKHQEAQRIIEEQKKSLDKWLDYLMKENTAYPMWARYWAFQGMLKLGMYDKEKNSFTRRSKGTTAPFVDLNPEALSYAIETVVLYQNGKEIDDDELKKLVKSGNFGKIYSHNLWKIANDEEKKDKTNSLDGVWLHYENGDGEEVARVLSGKGTGWCIASESTASSYLSVGTFDIYFTKDSQGEYTNPRACIRTENESIAEVRGINKDQNMEPEMTDIVDRKLDEFYDKKDYKKKVRDMNKLTEIYNKAMANIDLTKEELYFLFEIDYDIDGFGWEEDPRIEEIKENLIIKDREALLKLVKIDGDILKYADEKYKNDREIVLASIMWADEPLAYASKELQNDKEIVLEAVKRNGIALRHASEGLQNDKEVVFAAVKQDGRALVFASKRLQDDKSIVLEAIRKTGLTLLNASERLKDDRDVVLEAVESDVNAFRYASDRLRDDKEVVLDAVKKVGLAIKYASKRLKNDKEVVIEAAKQNGESFEFVSLDFKADRELVLEVVKQNGRALRYISEELQNDKEVVLAAVKQDGQALQYASERLQDDKEVVLAAVKQEGNALQYASERLQDDREVVLTAVKENGIALADASEELKKDKELVLEAIKNKIWAVSFVNKKLLLNDKEVFQAAIKYDYELFEQASDEIKNDKNIVLEVIKESSRYSNATSILPYIGEELRKDREIILESIKASRSSIWDIPDELWGDKEVVLEAMKQDIRMIGYAKNELRENRNFMFEILEKIPNAYQARRFISPKFRNDEELMKAFEDKKKNLEEYYKKRV